MTASRGHTVKIAIACLDEARGRRSVAAFAGAEVVQNGDCAGGRKAKEGTATGAVASVAEASGGGGAVEIAVAGENEAVGRFHVYFIETGKIMECSGRGDLKRAAKTVGSAEKGCSIEIAVDIRNEGGRRKTGGG